MSIPVASMLFLFCPESAFATATVALTFTSFISTRNKRHFNIDEHPRTPDPYEIQSKRAFEGRIKVWRRALHSWDTKG